MPNLFRSVLAAGAVALAIAPCRGPGQGPGHAEAWARRRHVRTVGQIRRGHRPRPVDRHRRDQRQGRPARQEGHAAGPRRRKQSRQGRGRRARTCAARAGRCPVRRPRHAGVAGHRSVRQRRQGAVHGRVGGRHADHAQRRGRELRVSRLCGRRNRRHRAGRLRGEEILRQEARDDPDQQSLGRVE